MLSHTLFIFSSVCTLTCESTVLSFAKPRQRPFCMSKQWMPRLELQKAPSFLFLPFLYLRPHRVCSPSSFFQPSFSQDSRGFYFSARNGVAALHGSKSLTRCRRFSPLDSLAALLAPTCLDCDDTPPIRSLTLASHPNKAPVNTRNVFREILPSTHTSQLSHCSKYFFNN